MRVKLPFLIISIVSSFQLVHARVQQPKESDEVIKICTELVVVDAHVLRKTGEVVRDLTKDDFILFEDGVEQQITHFSQDRLPMSIVLLLDLSGSVTRRLAGFAALLWCLAASKILSAMWVPSARTVRLQVITTRMHQAIKNHSSVFRKVANQKASVSKT